MTSYLLGEGPTRVYVSLLESIQDPVRMAGLITDGTVPVVSQRRTRGWKSSDNFNSSKHFLVDQHQLLAFRNGTTIHRYEISPAGATRKNNDPPIWEWIVFPINIIQIEPPSLLQLVEYQKIQWVFPILWLPFFGSRVDLLVAQSAARVAPGQQQSTIPKAVEENPCRNAVNFMRIPIAF